MSSATENPLPSFPPYFRVCVYVYACVHACVCVHRACVCVMLLRSQLCFYFGDEVEEEISHCHSTFHGPSMVAWYTCLVLGLKFKACEQ